MGFLSTLALILLTLVGYSSGAVLAGRGKKLTPMLFDVGAVVGLWAAALVLRGGLGRWLSILIWMVVAGFVSAGLTTWRRRRLADTSGGPSGGGVQVMNVFRRAWEGWKGFAAEMGNYQGRMLMAFFYFAVVTPFAALLRLFSDPLNTRALPQGSCWVERRDADTNLEEARGQF